MSTLQTVAIKHASSTSNNIVLATDGSSTFGNTIYARAAGSEGGELQLNNPDNLAAGLVVDVVTADIGRIYSTRNNSALQLGQLGGTGGSVSIYTAAAERVQIDSSGNLKFNSGYGSVATAYGCRAWVNFNGTSTVAIRGSGNITSITDNGTGDYTVNLTTALTDANYSAVGSCGTGTAGNDDFNLTSYFNTAPTTSALRVGTQRANSGVATDAAYIAVAIFR